MQCFVQVVWGTYSTIPVLPYTGKMKIVATSILIIVYSCMGMSNVYTMDDVSLHNHTHTQ